MSTLHSENVNALKQRLTQFPPHLQTILEGAVASIADASKPLRFTNTATGLRELIRELFVSISPDQSINAWLLVYVDSPSSCSV